MHIALVNYVYPADCGDPDALLGRYATLWQWAEALLAAGAARVSVGQRFGRDLTLTRGGVAYHFCADGGGPSPRWWTRPALLHRTLAHLRPDVAHINGLLFPAQTWLLRRALPTTTALVVQDHAGVVPFRGQRAEGRGQRSVDRGQRQGEQGEVNNAFLTSHPSPLSPLPSHLSPHYLLWRVGLRAADAFLFAAAEQAAPWRAAGLIDPQQPVYPVMESSTTLPPLPHDEARRTSGLRGDPALLWVGRLDANKDPLVVLDAFAATADQLPNAHLTMVYGSNELLPAVIERIGASPALAERVHLVGTVPHEELAAFYSAADIFVLGSHREGSGYALIEALACGATPVVTDIPSFRALTCGGRVGALWPPGDGAALARALLHIGRQNLAAQRQAVIDHFHHHWSWQAIGKAALEAYSKIFHHRGTEGTKLYH